jgi:hypothetical protein
VSALRTWLLGFVDEMSRSSLPPVPPQFPNPAGGVGRTAGSLGREPFVVVIMSSQHDLGPGDVQYVPQGLTLELLPWRPLENSGLCQ